MADENLEYFLAIADKIAKDPDYENKMSQDEKIKFLEQMRHYYQSLPHEVKIAELKEAEAAIEAQKGKITPEQYQQIMDPIKESLKRLESEKSKSRPIDESAYVQKTTPESAPIKRLEAPAPASKPTPTPISAPTATPVNTPAPTSTNAEAKHSENKPEEKKELTAKERHAIAKSELEQMISQAGTLSQNPKTLIQSYEFLKEAEKLRGKIGYENFDYYMKSHDQIRDIKKCGLESLLTSADEASKSSNSAVQALQLIDYVKEAAGYLNPFDTLRWKSASKADKIKKQAYESLVSTIKAGAKIPESAVQTLESISKTEEMLKNSYNILSPYRFQAGRELKEAKKTTLESMYRLAEDKIHSGDASGAMAMLEAADVETKKLGYFDSFAGYLKSRSKDITAMCGLRYMDAAEQKISSEAEGDKEAAKELVNKAKEISDKLGFFDSIRKQLDYRINRAYSTLA